jgi:hypothetical protein
MRTVQPPGNELMQVRHLLIPCLLRRIYQPSCTVPLTGKFTAIQEMTQYVLGPAPMHVCVQTLGRPEQVSSV